ncbi:DNA polymerase lambda isoform X4 [Cucurbita maxima]|uniref:DNA polymerase n=1 Tax=Cucurbita maxima TaxID=3661 RepID=A0A6J1JDJ0_CUCMA|nr:DNA polymerase lambda isoform X4 [Cucurbita maxima]
MAPKRSKSQNLLQDPHGMFGGMVVLLIEKGVQARRLQIWKQKLVQMGACIEDRLSKRVSHIFAASSDALLQKLDGERLARFGRKVLSYEWLEDSLRSGERASEDLYTVNVGLDGENGRDEPQPSISKKLKLSPNNSEEGSVESGGDSIAPTLVTKTATDQTVTNPRTSDSLNSNVKLVQTSMSYSPPDLNKNITDIFGKLINIYRALGDERRSFSYYKAIPVIEELPFKIESIDQVKHLPAIGKSLQDHIQEILTTGKLSKLEHFETDEKVRTISLFGEVWGIGPATALRLYDKGCRTLDDLQKESLTHAQKIGLKYFDDIKQRIPRNEVGCFTLAVFATLAYVSGSYCLWRIISAREVVLWRYGHCNHTSRWEKGTDSGVDTYFGLCTYPGRELRHRIDLKVYPRDIYAFGLLAWTGNDVLNRRLRLVAESKGFRMDDTGLYPATQGSGGKRGAKGSASLKFDTEKEIFEFLGFPWLEPHQRNL